MSSQKERSDIPEILGLPQQSSATMSLRKYLLEALPPAWPEGRQKTPTASCFNGVNGTADCDRADAARAMNARAAIDLFMVFMRLSVCQCEMQKTGKTLRRRGFQRDHGQAAVGLPF